MYLARVGQPGLYSVKFDQSVHMMVALYLSDCESRNAFKVLYWFIPLFNKQDLTEWTNQLLQMNLPTRSPRDIKTP